MFCSDGVSSTSSSRHFQKASHRIPALLRVAGTSADPSHPAPELVVESAAAGCPGRRPVGVGHLRWRLQPAPVLHHPIEIAASLNPVPRTSMKIGSRNKERMLWEGATSKRL